MSTININDGWKDNEHLELIRNAANGLVEMGLISDAYIEEIEAAIKSCANDRPHIDSE